MAGERRRWRERDWVAGEGLPVEAAGGQRGLERMERRRYMVSDCKDLAASSRRVVEICCSDGGVDFWRRDSLGGY